jgi:hypothetical protein
MSGSPDSFVAPTFEPLVLPLEPLIVCAFAKLSFAGPLDPDRLQLSVTLPV